MNRITLFLSIIVIFHGNTQAKGPNDTTPAKPNVLIILADDLGFTDIGAYGSEIATPNIDALAKTGLSFSQFYNTARFWSTRAALMTGYYAQQVRWEFRQAPLHVIDVVPTILALAGAKKSFKAPAAPGKSFVSLFNHEATIERDAIWWLHDGHKAIRMGDWKAMAPKNEPWQLYNLANDRIESVDLAKKHPEKLNDLINKWQQYTTEFTKQSIAE